MRLDHARFEHGPFERRRFDAALLGVGFLSLVQFLIWLHHFAPHIANFTDYAQRILNGHPDWRAVQNRLLGPFLLIDVLGWFPAPLPIFTALFTGLANFLFYRVAREIAGRASVALILLTLQIVLWTVLLSKLSFTFDLIEMSVLIWFFRSAVIKIAPEDATVTGLFIVQAFNRESALFLAAYLILLAPLRLILRDSPRLALREFAGGCALFISGAAMIEYLRKTMFIIGPAARAGADLKHRTFENFIIFNKNRVFFFVDLHGHWVDAKGPIFLVVFLLLHLVLAATGLYRKRAKLAAYGATMTLYTIAIFISAELKETRVLQILVPTSVLAAAWLVRTRFAAFEKEGRVFFS